MAPSYAAGRLAGRQLPTRAGRGPSRPPWHRFGAPPRTSRVPTDRCGLTRTPPLGVVPAWLGARGVGCAPNTAAPSGGEWFWPAEGHAASCWCCCPAYPGNPELPLEAAYATSNSNLIYGPSSSSSPPVQDGGGSSSGPTSSSGGDRRSLQVSCYDRVVLYLHGSAFALCSSKTHRVLIMSLVSKAGACVLSPDYRRPPEHPWPLPVDDCLAAYVGHVIITYTSPGLVV